MKKTFIISNYSSFYERIYTEDSYCLLFLKIKYLFKGYRVFTLPLYIILFFDKHFNIRLPYGTNISFEKFIKGTDQCTWLNPYDNYL